MCRGKEVAIKKLFKQDLDDKSLADFKKEVEIMAQLRHPNVLLFMGACTDPGQMAIVTELLDGGNGEQVLRDPSLDLSILKRVVMALEVAQGMSWLHASKPQIIHRDLKPSNLLVDENLHVKVCDFGLSQVKEDGLEKLQDTDSVPGTPLWMAPEVLLGKPFDASSDVYSFGIVLWEMLTKEEVYPEFTSFGAFKRAICYKHHRPTPPPGIPSSLASLLERCWHRDAGQRPSFQQLIKMLELVMVDVGVEDAHGQEFWKRHLAGRAQVSWDKFAAALTAFHNLPAPEDAPADLQNQLLFLRHMLAERKANAPKDSLPDLVTLESFGRPLKWFGPMGAGPDWIVGLRHTMQQMWFHGDVNSKEAEKSLSGRKKGTFLVRLSASHPGQFTISKVASKGINHQRFSYTSGTGFTLKTTKGTGKNKKPHVIKAVCSLEEFIRKHLAKDLGLTVPCPGSPFAALCGHAPEHEKGTSAGYIICDSDEDEM